MNTDKMGSFITAARKLIAGGLFLFLTWYAISHLDKLDSPKLTIIIAWSLAMLGLFAVDTLSEFSILGVSAKIKQVDKKLAEMNDVLSKLRELALIVVEPSLFTVANAPYPSLSRKKYEEDVIKALKSIEVSEDLITKILHPWHHTNIQVGLNLAKGAISNQINTYIQEMQSSESLAQTSWESLVAITQYDERYFKESNNAYKILEEKITNNHALSSEQKTALLELPAVSAVKKYSETKIFPEEEIFLAIPYEHQVFKR